MVSTNYFYLIIVVIIAQRDYETRHDCVGKVIHWEFCKKFKFDHTNKSYTHNIESVLENKMHRILWDFQIQRDHLISARRPDLVRQLLRSNEITKKAVEDDSDINSNQSIRNGL